ncbi:MAG: hypothetical protein ABIR92_09800, partial [Gemmatimonadaceae bacterium]
GKADRQLHEVANRITALTPGTTIANNARMTMTQPPGPPGSDSFHLIWLTGPSCDGCTIGALGDTTLGGLEALLTGQIAGIPPIAIAHPALSFESGDRFTDILRRAADGTLGPFALIVEASIPNEPTAGGGFFSGIGDEGGQPVTIATWVDRLAPRAAAVVAFGDCGVWGGPHSLAPNPAGATGTTSYLGTRFRSTLGLPVINLPGCCAPPVLLATLVTLLRHAGGSGPPLDLDEMNCPRSLYPEAWKGALAVWTE